MYRTEHPRPHFYRDSWQTLNGVWEFEIEKSKRDFFGNQSYKDKINVPFCPESKLSGIEYKGSIRTVWYRRKLDITKKQLEGRIILHFGAVDYIATVYINNELVGEHKGGYVSFSFDVTDFLKEGENTLIVKAWDNTKSPRIPSGKQSMINKSVLCVYTRTTGIWQSVWIEYTNKSYIKNCKITADVDSKSITLQGNIREGNGKDIIVNVLYKDELVESVTKKLTDDTFSIDVIIKKELKLWQPLAAELYDIELILSENENIVDKVITYCGFRKVEIKDKCIYINDKPIFQRLVLDQGFYPEGIYTAPSKEDLLYDIELGIKYGFNGARPHEKVFEERYLYYADKLGYILWGEFPNWGAFVNGKKSLDNFLVEWEEAVKRDYNHPSIIGWCPLNETYGLFGSASAKCSVAIYDKTKEVDPTRIVIGSSGGFHYKTDICDMHSYTHNAEEIVAAALRRNNGIAFGIIGKIKKLFSKGKLLSPKELEEYPLFLSEFGGLTYMQEGKSWGYHKAISSEEEFIEKYKELVDNVIQCKDICAFCFTQLTDVEQEQNGLVKYNRKSKFSDKSIERIAEINKQKAKIED